MARRRRSKKWIGVLMFLILAVVAVVMVVLVKNNLFGDKAEKNNSHTDTSVEQNKDEKKDDNKPNDQKADSKEEVKVPQYEGESPNKSETLTGLITYADVSGEDLVVRVNIDQFLQEGNCSLSVIKNGANLYSETVAIQESVSTSTCDGFKIPVSRLSKGDLQIEILLESGDRNGKITGRVRI